jgi:hypothetical protein
MYARAVDEAAARLRELRREEWERFGLALVAMALALAAAQSHHTLTMPLFLGSLVVGALGVRTFWRRWDLVDRLSGEPDAHAIAEILDYASREATLERRRGYAVFIRRRLKDGAAYDTRLERVADELDGLACELEDSGLTLDPACAVACRRLVSDPAESALFDQAVPAEELLARIRRIRFGLTPASGHPADELDANERPPRSPRSRM